VNNLHFAIHSFIQSLSTFLKTFETYQAIIILSKNAALISVLKPHCTGLLQPYSKFNYAAFDTCYE